MVKEISVIIVNWNGEDVIQDSLDAVYSSQFDFEKLEVIVVDNNSKDNSIQMVKSHFPEVIIIPEKINHGFAEGNNIGFRRSTGKFIAMINNDLVIDKEWFRQCLNGLQTKEV